jgi:RNA polymerase sigma-70 factor (ECF subfamily)
MELLSTRLMSAAKQGDRAAYDELVTALRARAFALASALVGSREDALELTQDAFLKAYQARAQYRESEPFLPWFHRILRNTCFSFLRKHRRLRPSSLSAPDADEEPDWELDAGAPDPAQGIEEDEAAQALRTAFARLGARDREILALRHFEELSYKEIATRLSIPEGTVMSRLFHARARLKEELAPHLAGALQDFAPTAGRARKGLAP